MERGGGGDDDTTTSVVCRLCVRVVIDAVDAFREREQASVARRRLW